MDSFDTYSNEVQTNRIEVSDAAQLQPSSFQPASITLEHLGELLATHTAHGGAAIKARRRSENIPESTMQALPTLCSEDIEQIVAMMETREEAEGWILPIMELGREVAAAKIAHNDESFFSIGTRLAEILGTKAITGSGIAAAAVGVILDDKEMKQKPLQVLGMSFHILTVLGVEVVASGLAKMVLDEYLMRRFESTHLQYREALRKEQQDAEITAIHYAIRQLPRRERRALRREYRQTHPKLQDKHMRSGFYLDYQVAKAIHRYTMNRLYPESPSRKIQELQLMAVLDSIRSNQGGTFSIEPLIANELITVGYDQREKPKPKPQKVHKAFKSHKLKPTQFHKEDLI